MTIRLDGGRLERAAVNIERHPRAAGIEVIGKSKRQPRLPKEVIGQHDPPEPTCILVVDAARSAINTDDVVLARNCMQIRTHP